MKKEMTLMLAILLLIMLPIQAMGVAEGFIDMPDDWSTAALQNAVDNGLLKGANGKIMSKDTLTRAQMATIINRAFGAEVKASLEGFVDVVESDWFYTEMAKAVAMGTFQGSGNSLNANEPITREQAFAVIVRALNLGQSTVEPAGFSDLSGISSWATGEVYSLVNNGYIQGSNGKLNPQGYITRAEFAQVMNNVIKQYVNRAGEYTISVAGNAMVNAPGATLSNSIITGDLVIGDGVGEKEVVLDDVVVTGGLLVRGGGTDAIIIKGNSVIGSIIVAKVNGTVIVYAEEGTETGDIVVDGKDDVIVEGTFADVIVLSNDVTVWATNATIDTATVEGDNSKIIIGNNSTIKKLVLKGARTEVEVSGTVEQLEVEETAEELVVTIDKDGEVEEIAVNSPGTLIKGEGKVREVKANANDVVVETEGTKVTASKGTEGVMAGDEKVDAGKSKVVGEKEAKPSGRSSGGSTIPDPVNPEDPVDPEDPEDVEITAFDAIADIDAGTAGSATYADSVAVIAILPTTATANSSVVTVPVTTWIDTDSYDPTIEGSYTFTAILGSIPVGFVNTGGYTATVEVVVATVGVALGNDATLNDLTVAGTSVADFDKATLTYDVGLAAGTTTVPTVIATVADTGKATAVVTDAESLPGSTTVIVTAEDGTTTQTYTINFTVANAEQDAPTGLAGVAPTSASNDDGKITGTTTEMEYKLSAASVWTTATETEIIGLAPGIYEVRYAAKDGYNAGTAVETIIGAYDLTAQDNIDIASAKANIQAATYTTTQVEALDAGAALTKAQELVDALELEGTTVTVVAGDFTGATAGAVGTPDGTDGSYTFTVKINKGEGTEVISAEQTMTITATAYDASQDNLDISSAKTNIEAATYTATQVEAPDAGAALTKAQELVNGLELEGTTVTVVAGTFNGATTGAVGTPDGTDGFYTFTVKINKGEGTEVISDEQTMTITATEYVPAIPDGTLLDAEAGSNFTGVLYTRDGNVYFNQRDSANNWSEEVFVGVGAEGKIAVDNSNQIHIAYTTSDDKIGYAVYDGTTLGTVELIESNNAGKCYWPDISLDTAGNPHIMYVDSMGDTRGTRNQPDVMYALKSGGDFTKQLLYSGYYDSYDKGGGYPAEKNPLIGMDQNDNRYVFYQWRSYSHYMYVYHDRGIKVVGSNSQSLGSIGSNSNRFDIYDLKSINGKLYALYRSYGDIKVSEMTIDVSGTIGSLVDRAVFAASSASSLSVYGDDIVIGSKDASNNLQTHYNGTPKTFTDISVDGNVVSIVHLNGNFYAVYTDSSDGNIKTQLIEAPTAVTATNSITNESANDMNVALDVAVTGLGKDNFAITKNGATYTDFTVTEIDAQNYVLTMTDVAVYGEEFTVSIAKDGYAFTGTTVTNSVAIIEATATITGYFVDSDGTDTALETTTTVANGTEEETAKAGLPTAGFAKLSDGTYEAITIAWAFDEAYIGTVAGDKVVIGTVSGTFAGGQIPIDQTGTVTVEEAVVSEVEVVATNSIADATPKNINVALDVGVTGLSKADFVVTKGGIVYTDFTVTETDAQTYVLTMTDAVANADIFTVNITKAGYAFIGTTVNNNVL